MKMPKKYTFEFQGTKEEFFEILNRYPSNNGKFYYFDDYIVELQDDEIRFGIERAGHSGGNWFVSKINEGDGRIYFSGTIKYIGQTIGQKEKIKKPTVLEKIGDAIIWVIALILLLPLILIWGICVLMDRCVRKIFKRAKPKPMTTEEKLYDLMKNRLHCVEG